MLNPPASLFESAHHGSLTYWQWRVAAGKQVRGAVVFLHGWGDHGGRNAELAEYFTAAGFECFAPDFSGHGRSSGARAEVHDFDDLLDDLHAFLAHIAPKGPLFLCGHSMGGCLAAHYAIRHPEALRGVMFCSAALAINRKIPRVKRAASRVLGRLMPRLSVGQLKGPTHMARSVEAQVAYANDALIHHGSIDAGTGLCLLRANAWLERHAGELNVPFVALQGQADELVAPDGPERLRSQARGEGTVVLFPEARHDLCLELGAERVAQELLGWLQALGGVGGGLGLSPAAAGGPLEPADGPFTSPK